MAKPQRPGKGESVLCLPRDYTVVDTETTGLSTESCCLIEVSALRVREGRVAAEVSTLIRPPWREVQKNGQWQQGYVDDFIQMCIRDSPRPATAAAAPAKLWRPPAKPATARAGCAATRASR